LSSADLAFLQPDLDSVSLDLRQVLETANEPITHNYFIDHGIASIVAGNGNHGDELKSDSSDLRA
jgi:hypothetical protein